MTLSVRNAASRVIQKVKHLYLILVEYCMAGKTSALIKDQK